MVRVLGPLLGQWATDLYGVRPVRVDELLHLRYRLEALYEQIRDGLARGDDLPYVPTAFATFSTRWSAAVVASSLHDRDEGLWRADPAPGPGELHWGSLRLRLWQLAARRAAARTAFVGLLLTYAVPVSALQGLLQIRRLSSVPVIGSLVRVQLLRSLLSGLLPGAALRLLLLLLPGLLAALVRWAGAASKGEADARTMALAFDFQVECVCLVFCPVNPLVLPACLLYFGLAGLLERYQLAYVWRREYESGGQLWSQVFRQVMVGLYTSHVVMLGLLSIKRFPFAPLLLPATAAAAAFHRAATRMYDRPWRILALRDAADLDQLDEMYGSGVGGGGGAAGGGGGGGGGGSVDGGGEAAQWELTKASAGSGEYGSGGLYDDRTVLYGMGSGLQVIRPRSPSYQQPPAELAEPPAGPDLSSGGGGGGLRRRRTLAPGLAGEEAAAAGPPAAAATGDGGRPSPPSPPGLPPGSPPGSAHTHAPRTLWRPALNAPLAPMLASAASAAAMQLPAEAPHPGPLAAAAAAGVYATMAPPPAGDGAAAASPLQPAAAAAAAPSLPSLPPSSTYLSPARQVVAEEAAHRWLVAEAKAMDRRLQAASALAPRRESFRLLGGGGGGSLQPQQQSEQPPQLAEEDDHIQRGAAAAAAAGGEAAAVQHDVEYVSEFGFGLGGEYDEYPSSNSDEEGPGGVGGGSGNGDGGAAAGGAAAVGVAAGAGTAGAAAAIPPYPYPGAEGWRDGADAVAAAAAVVYPPPPAPPDGEDDARGGGGAAAAVAAGRGDLEQGP
ncbi:hypothetical protein GPECTOR_75g716 [Gonium pectorale]|uniref:CSC1/OSCA1-like 7TM region domain-containing protein n=1 Tax=Gonium pectorale TaxID=33097 RepID=A0A150G2E6_GONPE|nr:hypothetical protein GPECTOR_75g716 [Gonium pectorale]|eukprot:KXZ43993.1 hypothetical protein GPECTOR_75g716 [Gonium pectorale]